MSNETLALTLVFIGIILLEITFLAMFILILLQMRKSAGMQDARARAYGESFEKLLENYDLLKHIEEDRNGLYDRQNKVYELIVKAYREMGKNQERLLECWQEVGEGYNNVQDEFHRSWIRKRTGERKGRRAKDAGLPIFSVRYALSTAR